jgi:hypothetical protein
MKHHHLKTWPEYFQPVIDKRKRFEIRRDDRDFGVGDSLTLEEWDPRTKSYTGREAFREIVYIAKGVFGLPPDCCVLGIE